LVSKWYLIDTKLTLDTWWEPCKAYNEMSMVRWGCTLTY
jgi:hypothetical protein